MNGDAGLWAEMISTLRSVGIGSNDAEVTSRALVAQVRRRCYPDRRTWGPGDAIPPEVVSVYDLDGDVWDRQVYKGSPMTEAWKMRGHDPDEHEAAAGGVYLTPHLLTEYGPLTEAGGGR